MTYGRLAQLVEHLLDVQEVTGSSPVPSTKRKAVYLKKGKRLFLVSTCFLIRKSETNSLLHIDNETCRRPPFQSFVASL